MFIRSITSYNCNKEGMLSSILTGSPHLRPWASCLPKVDLGSLSRKTSTWLRTVSILCAPGKIVW